MITLQTFNSAIYCARKPFHIRFTWLHHVHTHICVMHKLGRQSVRTSVRW